VKLVAQRVVRLKDGATGINAYCYLHPGRNWLERPPADLGRGQLTNRLIEIDPPAGNRVRSYLDITTPDATSDEEISRLVLEGANLQVDFRKPLPWALNHGEISFEFSLERSLAEQWQLELRILLGYALHVRLA
jgi:hypothetical protein